MRARLEVALLAAAALAVAAFLVSFGLGLRGPAGDAAAAASDADAPSLIADAPPDTGAPVAPLGPRVRVEVLNGTRHAGLARTATERLRADGFDVVFFGNAEGGRRDSTLVLDRRGRPGAARAVADALGVGRVERRNGGPPDLDVTVVLGRDWPPPGAARAAGGWVQRLERRVRAGKQAPVRRP